MKNKSEYGGKNTIKDLDKYKDLMLMAMLSKYFEKIESLEERIISVENKIDILLQAQRVNTDMDVIVVKEVPYEDAKNKVINYFKEHKEATIIDLHRDLGIPLDTLVEIIDELNREGIIGD